MKRRYRAIACILVVSSLIAIDSFGGRARAQSTTQPTSRPAVTVQIENFTFKPKNVEIGVGDTVTWKNTDDVPHTATSKDDPQTFDSGALDTDDTYSFTFSKPGKYAYYCKVHPHMTGTIIVK
jgi:plastocyanin